MFKRTQNLLKQYQKPIPFHMPILPDNDGYYDKECPNPECLSKFKVNAEDWKNLFSDDEVHCPFCGYVSPANTWWTTEHAKEKYTGNIADVKDKYNPDPSDTNKASIIMVIEFENKKLLFTGDSAAESIVKALDKYCPEDEFEIVKLPHHGSEYNISRELIRRLNTKQFIVSTNKALEKVV